MQEKCDLHLSEAGKPAACKIHAPLLQRTLFLTGLSLNSVPFHLFSEKVFLLLSQKLFFPALSIACSPPLK